jgi:hypothetical protein
MGWKVQNNGSTLWDQDSIVFAYYSGTKMYFYSPARLERNVDPGDSIALSASMVAPKSSGAYTTIWALRKGAFDFCHVSLRIIVP